MWQHQYLQAEEATSKTSVPGNYHLEQSIKYVHLNDK